MAEAWLRSLSGPQVVVESAGLEAHGLNPYAVKVMEEVGIAMSGHRSTVIDQVDLSSLDVLVTVCDHAKERCPVFPSEAKQHHYNFPDPAKATGTEEEIMTSFKKTRDLVKDYLREFVKREMVSV